MVEEKGGTSEGERDGFIKIRRQPPVVGVNVGLFLLESVGILTCLPSKFERDRQPREITYIEV